MKEKIILLIMAYFLQEAKSLPDQIAEDYLAQYRETRNLLQNPGLAKISGNNYNRDLHPRDMASQLALVTSSVNSALELQIRRTQALLSTLKSKKLSKAIENFEAQFQSLVSEYQNPVLAKAGVSPNIEDQNRYLALRKLARSAALSNALLSDFDDIVYIERDIVGVQEYDGNHMCDQFFGHNAKKGGGLFLLKNFKSGNPQKINLLKGLRIPGGINQGMLMEEGSVLSPELSWDAKTVVFAWRSGGAAKWARENRFNLFQINIHSVFTVM